METLTMCFFGFAALVVLLVAILSEERAKRVKSTANMILKRFSLSAVIQAFKRVENKSK